VDRSISATLGDAREVNMCVHARFDSYVKAYYFAQTLSPKCTIRLSRNTFLLNLCSWSRMSVSKYNTVSVFPQALMNVVIDSTKMYRGHFASSLQASQFNLPTSLHLLPLFVTSLLKHVSTRAGK